ncbi:MAG TPA: DUF1206 domain-containing protein [Anaeromyxobacter sp.]|nr:DUF1206 domain-containing protein [Anaeromyxobacter sp.]
MTPGGAARSVERAGDRSAGAAPVRRLARAGYVARGVVYAVMGAVALRVAIGAGGAPTDSKGAIATVATAPFGRVLVLALAAGLTGMALWTLVEAIGDPERRRRAGTWAALSRLGQAVAGAGYAALALAAVRLATGGSAGPSGDRAAEAWTARALALPGGRWLVLAGAAVAAFVGGRQIWLGVRRRFLEKLDVGAMSAPVRRCASVLGTAGLAAQGTVFVLVGAFFAFAALRRSSREAAGFDGALAAIAAQPSGAALLGAVALGLLAYAAFSVVEGRHGRLGGR